MNSITYHKIFKNIKKYFWNMNPDFIMQMDMLFFQIAKEIAPKYVQEEDLSVDINKFLVDSIHNIPPLDYNEAIRIATEFFASFNFQDAVAFQNLIRDSKIKFSVKGKKEIHSSSKMINLTGTYYDVILLVHEFVHNFSNWNDDCSLVVALLDESNAIAYEIKATQFLMERYDVSSFMYKVRLLEFISCLSNTTQVNDCFYIFFDLLKKDKLDYGNYKSFLKCLSLDNQEKLKYLVAKFFTNSNTVETFTSNYVHKLGFLIANYLISQNNELAINKITNVLSAQKELEPEVIAYLENDIPIFKDGKVSLKGDNYSKLLNAIPDYMMKFARKPARS